MKNRWWENTLGTIPVLVNSRPQSSDDSVLTPLEANDDGGDGAHHDDTDCTIEEEEEDWRLQLRRR